MYTANTCYITIAVYITADHNQQNNVFTYHSTIFSFRD